uniref:Dynein heavy chain C-terminal domain-containing protein n=1 Tax=Poecilia mexicana TaxID=48701 RepID=A0A3B3YFW8_9TELE
NQIDFRGCNVLRTSLSSSKPDSSVKDSRLYSCPIYKKPVRTDMNYISTVDLKTSLHPEHWILRGVALLCDVK